MANSKRVRPRRKVEEELVEGFVNKDGLPTTEKPKQRKKFSAEERENMLERELRRYVKRSGGFRKNLPKSHKEVAKRIMKKLGRKKPEWDNNIVVAGLDNPTVARLDVAHS